MRGGRPASCHACSARMRRAAPFANGHNQPGALRHANKLQRIDQPLFRALPAQQCLRTDDSAGLDVHLRLVVDYEFLTFQRMVQPAFHLHLLDGSGVEEGRGEELVAISALLLGVVHGGIGVLHQGLGDFAVSGVNGNAYAGGDIEFMTAQRQRLFDGFKDFLGNPGSVFRLSHSRQ